MTGYTFDQLVDLNRMRQLLESHHSLSGMAYGLFDTGENCLIAVGWQDICARFHRAHPVTSARCRERDACIKERLHAFRDDPFEYRCKNGMIDVAMPIVVDGAHLATFFTGQFFYEHDRPDRAFFLTQAKELGFDPEEYLEALDRVPVFGREHIRGNVVFLHDMVRVMAEMGLNSLRLAGEVAQRKRAQKRLALMDFALDHVKEEALLIDEVGDFLYVNEEACRRLGYSREELLQLSIYELDPDCPAGGWANHWSALVKQGALTFERRHRTQGGELFPVEVTATYFEYEGQSYNLALVRDISERKRLENEVKTSRDFLSNVINTIADPIFVKDAEHRLVLANDAECALAGCTREELLGRTDYDFFPKEQVDIFWRIDDEVLASGVPRHNEELITDANGTVRTIVVHKSRYIDPQGDRFVVGVIRDITERKRNEEALGEKAKLQERISAMAEAVPGFIFTFRVDPDGHMSFPYASSGVEEMFGLGPEEIRADAAMLRARYHSDDLVRILELMVETSRSLAPFRIEIRVDYPEEGERWVEIRSTPQRQPDGAVEWHGLMIDVTERKRMEEALAVREQEFRALVENSPDYIVRYDRDCRRIYINPALERVFGRPAHELLGMGPGERTPLPDAAGYEQAVRSVLENGRECQMEFQFFSAEGEQRWGHLRVVPEFDRDGNVVTVLAIGRDVSAIKEAEQELRASEQRFREIFDNSLDCLYLLEVTEDGRFRNLEVNPASERSFGMSRAELIGKCVDETVPEETARTVMAKYRRCLEAGTTIEEETELDLPYGRRSYHSTLVPVRDDTGRFYRIIGITRDITERNRMEEAIHSLNQTLKSRLLALTQPVGDLSNIQLSDLFDIDELQKVQDAFAQATGVAALITDTQGQPITKPSNFCRLCEHVIRKTEKGLLNCSRSDAFLGRKHQNGGGIQRCLSGGLWDAGTSICVGDHHIANWLIGQILDESEDEEAILAYAEEIGADKEACREALKHVTRMPLQQFEKIAGAFDLLANQLSKLALQNVQQARFITGRKESEEALCESEQRFRTLAENSPNIIVRYDRECRRTFVNPTYVRETGFAAELAQNATPDELWSDVSMSAAEYGKRLEEVMETGAPAKIVLELRRQGTGHITWHAFHVVAERDPDGKISGCLAIGHNITALKDAELRLSKLAAGVPGFLYTYRLRPDGTACLPYASPQIKEIYGFVPEAVTEDATELITRIHAEDVSRVRDSIAESARTLSPWHAEYRIRHPEKGDLWVEGRSMPEPQADGGVLWFGFVHDISQRKRIEEKLRAKREQLAALTLELSLAEERERLRIAAQLHDHIGQTLLLGRIKLGALSDIEVSEPVRKAIDEARDLLDQATNDAHSLTVQLNPPILAAAGLEAALEWLGKRMAADYGLQVEYRKCGGKIGLKDELRSIVYQCARELLINVAKHAGTGRARLDVGHREGMYALTVEDEGGGFDVAALTPDTSKDCRLGLFSIQIKVERLGGRALFESMPGAGSRMTIMVPIG